MATTIVRRIRALLASETDDWYSPADLLDYANEAKKSIVSTAIKLELDQPKRGGRSIRALQSLRSEKTFSSLTFTAHRTFYQVDIALPTSEPIYETHLHIGAEISGSPIILTEIPMSRFYEMDWGNLKPTANQGYWYQFTDQDAPNDPEYIRLFFVTNDAATTVKMRYIKTPILLQAADENLVDLPDRLIHAVVYGGAINGGIMEIKQNTKDYFSMYQDQLNRHLW